MTVAESETQDSIIVSLISSIQTCMRPESIIKINEKLLQSPHISVERQKFARSGIQKSKKQEFLTGDYSK